MFTWIGMYCYYSIDVFAAIRAVELSANMQRPDIPPDATLVFDVEIS